MSSQKYRNVCHLCNVGEDRITFEARETILEFGNLKVPFNLVKLASYYTYQQL